MLRKGGALGEEGRKACADEMVGTGVLSIGAILVSSIKLLLDAVVADLFVKGHAHPLCPIFAGGAALSTVAEILAKIWMRRGNAALFFLLMFFAWKKHKKHEKATENSEKQMNAES